MKDYYYKMSNWICIDKYEIFFELNQPDFMLITNLYFGLTYIKLLDQALRYSKENILKESEKDSKDLFDVAIYPSGEALNFYNVCPFDLGDISNIVSNSEIRDKLLNYIDGFNKNVKEVFSEIEFKNALDFLVDYDLLSEFIKMAYFHKFDDDYFLDYDSFVDLFEKFIYHMVHDEYYNMGLVIENYDPESSFPYIRESIDEYGEFLNKLLLTDSNIGNKYTYNIFDPNSNGAYILHKTKRDILKVNLHAETNLFGKSQRNESKAIYLAKRSISKTDPYSISDATILNPEDDIIANTELGRYGDLDFIITNSICSKSSEYKKILNLYLDGKLQSTKSVLAFKTIDDIITPFVKIIEKDILEAIIYFSTHYILILNPEKSDGKKGKFLFIDKSDVEEEYKVIGRSRQSDFYSNSQFELFNVNSAIKLSEFDKNNMKSIIELYKKYEDSDFSRIIKNKDFDYETITLLFI